MAKQPNWLVWGVILLGAFAILAPVQFQSMVGSVTGGFAPAGDGVITPTSAQAQACGVSPAVRLTLTDAVLGTNVADANGILHRNGALSAEQTLTSDATFDVSVGDAYEFIVENSGTTATYYPFRGVNGTALCASDQLQASPIKAVGSLTSTIYNDDDVTANVAITGEQAFSAGQTKKFRLKLTGNTDNAYFGDGAVAVCADYNGSAFTSLSMSSLTSGRDVVAISTPYGQTSQDTTNNLYNKCWEVSGDVKEFDELQLRLTVQASGTIDPMNDSNMNIRVIDRFLMQNDMGEWGEFYFDPDTAGTIGATDRTDIIHIS